MCKKAEDPHKLSVSALLLIGAIFWGLYIFVAALFVAAGIETLWFSSQTFAMLASIYPGLTATAAGALIGLVWGIICGAVCGGLFGVAYNFIIDKTKFAKRI